RIRRGFRRTECCRRKPACLYQVRAWIRALPRSAFAVDGRFPWVSLRVCSLGASLHNLLPIDGIDPHLRVASFHVDKSEVMEQIAAAGRGMHGFGNQNLTGFRAANQPCRDVYRVTDGGVL